MSDLLATFEADCKIADISPTAALKAGGVHPTLWKKWKEDHVSPTLKNFEKAQRGLAEVIRRKKQAATQDEAAA